MAHFPNMFLVSTGRLILGNFQVQKNCFKWLLIIINLYLAQLIDDPVKSHYLEK